MPSPYWSRTTPLHSNFSGLNDEVVLPAEYFDYRLNNMAAQLSPDGCEIRAA
jgi:hypothetical protein